MAIEKRIPLTSPIGVHDKIVKEVVLREPRSGDYFSLGDPIILAQNSDGSLFPVENGDIIRAYLDRCVIDPDPIMIGQLGLADAMAVKAALLDFFSEARETLSKPATSSAST